MLTEEQAETIQQPDAAKLICALPGSGKTHTFISLVEKILAVDSRYTVLMVTFTNASAKEMFDRVHKRLGRAAVKLVKAATFASLMLNQYRPIAKGRRLIMGTDQYSFVRRALSQTKVLYDDLDKWVSKIEHLGGVLVAGMNNGSISPFEVEAGKSPSPNDSADGIEAERRLLYVEMTHAEVKLYISFRKRKANEFISEIIVQHAN